MRRLAFLVLLFASAPVVAQDTVPSGPFVRAQLDPSGPVMVGQRVELAIDVFVPTWFTSPPQLPPLDIGGAFAAALPRTSHQVEQIGGGTWSAVRYYYAITAQTPGTIRVPPLALTFTYAIDARPSEPVTVTTTSLNFEAHLPPGAERLDYFFAAPDLQLSERYDPQPPQRLSVGDAFSRRIVISATDVDALTLPPLPDTDVPGFQVTTDPPEITSTHGRGDMHVERTTRLTYTATTPGTFTLPPVTIPYWSTTANAVLTRELPALRLEVSAAPAFAEEIALPPEPEVAQAPPSRWAPVRKFLGNWWRMAVGVGLLLWFVTRLTRRHGPRLARWAAQRRRRRLESESHYFGLVRQAARTGDLRATHAAALAWLARVPSMRGMATLPALADRTTDDELRALVASVNEVLFARGEAHASPSLASSFADALAAARRRLSRQHQATSVETHRLAPLNPR